MMKRFLIAAAGACLLATSCEITGDPTRGGIFWSPTKAQERQMALEDELGAYNSDLRHERRRNANLVARRNKLLAEIRQLDNQIRSRQGQGGNDAETQALIDRRARLQAQLDALR